MNKAFKRLTACIAPPVLFLVASLVLGCSDAGRPLSPEDDWAESVLATARVRSDFTTLDEGKPLPSVVSTATTKLRVLRGFPWEARSEKSGLTRRGEGEVVIRHFRDKHRKVHSLAMLLDGSGKPAKRFYVFEDAKIKVIVNPTYQRRGNGFVRVKTRATFFDSNGKPLGQANESVESLRTSAPATRLMSKALADALSLFVPRELHAEETDEGCVTEWVLYAAAGWALASTSAALASLTALCVSGNLLACGGIEKAIGLFAAALAAWNVALDKLVECQQRGSTSSNEPLTDGADGGGGGSDNQQVDMEALRRTVRQFVDASIAAGSYWCSESRDYCVYYGG